jgi:tetratricopeptide (TPR) repeat protein
VIHTDRSTARQPEPNHPIVALLILLLTATSAVAAQDEPTPAPTLEAAIEFARSDRADEAIAVLEELSSGDGLSPEGTSMLGMLYFERGQPEQSLAVLQQVLELDEPGKMALVTAARAAFSLNRTDQAEAWMRQAIALAPTSNLAREYGFFLGSQRRFAEAIDILTPYAQSHPEDLVAVRAVIAGALEADQLETANEVAALLEDGSPLSTQLKASVALRRGETFTAQRVLEQLESSQPLDENLTALLGETYLALGEYGRAIERLQSLPSSNHAYALLLSKALYRSGNFPMAAEVLSPFLAVLDSLPEALDPSSAMLAANLATEYARARMAQGETEDLVALLQKATRIGPQAAEAWNLLGQNLIAIGQMTEAKAAIGRSHYLTDTQTTPAEGDS